MEIVNANSFINLTLIRTKHSNRYPDDSTKIKLAEFNWLAFNS